jgi:xanthine/CO dehydrogenase XdhC/CoxF family maturation factor
VLPAVELDHRTAEVILSHNFLRDAEDLRHLFGTPVFYIGLLGPRQRSERPLDYLEQQEDLRPGGADLAKPHAPAGLDIGAEGPLQIAWSILAELLAVLNQRPGASLRQRRGPIHEDVDRSRAGRVGAPMSELSDASPNLADCSAEPDGGSPTRSR